MTRQWLADPKYMCQKHLSGEHLEAHIFVTKMLHGTSLKGFRDGSMFFGAGFVYNRHNEIALYLPGHKTPMELLGRLISEYPDVTPTHEDYQKSLKDLFTRCPECVQKHAIGLKSLRI